MNHDIGEQLIPDFIYRQLLSQISDRINESNIMVQSFDDQKVKDKPTLKEKIEMAQEAYDTLSNKEKREAYDAVAQVKKKLEPAAPVKPGSLQFMGHKDQSKNPKHQNVYQDFFGFSEKPCSTYTD